MGCCLSTHENKTIPKHHQNHQHHYHPTVSKSPPRAEEEAVKEVLSETPKPKPKLRSRPESPARVGLEEDDATKPKLFLLTTPTKKVFLEQSLPTTGYPDPCTPEEISEVSEMCSVSESISTNTLKEEEYQHQLIYCNNNNNNKDSTVASTTSSGEIRQRVYRSQGYNGHLNHFQQHQQHQYNKNQGKSPARRRPEPSPPRRRYPGSGGTRKELVGDNSGRRSQSPGMRANVGRSPSARRTGPSPGRVRMVHGPDNGRKMEEEEVVDNEEDRRESEEWEGPKESLENPLVSLECFIFL